MSSTEHSRPVNGGAVVPILHTVPFHDDTLVTLAESETHYVAMRRVVENMGLDWKSQHAKLKQQSAKFACGDITTHDASGRLQPMLCMPVEKLQLWLACINANKVRADLRSKVERYQTESAIVLHDYWTRRSASAASATVAELMREVEKLTAIVTDLAISHDPRRAALEYASVCELLDEAGALPKGRNSLNRRVGYDLKQRSLKTVANDDPSPVRRAAHTGTWLYKREFADRYMRERGLALVADHNAKVTGGQGVIKFPDRRKTSNEAHPST